MKSTKSKIKLWTIQSPLAWSILKDKGVLMADGRRVDKAYQKAYRWMMEQMKDRLVDYHGHFPIWCWYTPKPDLRRKAHLISGQKGIRIEFETSRDKVLLSDFDSWHYVLNNQYLALDEKGEINNNNINESWNRIFDLELLNKSELTGPVENIQGVVEEILLDDVIRIQEFTAR